MSMTNPTEKEMAMVEFYRANMGKTFTMFGAAWNADHTKRYEFVGCPGAHEMAMKMMDGSGSAAGIEYTKMADFFANHAGHPMTHLGSMVSDKGFMDAWYCQRDDKVCYDTKS